eukprot:gene21199-23281_t
MNRTLFACGFKKKVELKDGQLYDITATLSNAVNLVTKKSVKCDFCQEVFSGKQYLETHVRFKHATEGNLPEPSTHSSSKATPCQDQEGRDDDTFKSSTKESYHAAEDKVEYPLLHQHHAEKRRGRKQRRSYTVEFKKQTLDLLEQLTATKKKWNKVAEARGINKSLVIKWNKNRQTILQEIALNKQNKIAGGIRAARQRRKMTGVKANHSERYPLAANLLVSEFKLRRAKGSKISKIWFRKKMKSKIEQCYGKKEADKFKASNNWFQRFKRTHKIVLRHRTNKKKDSANDGRKTIQEFHRNLRKSLQTTRRRNNSTLNPKYGRWLPENRYNIDQVPLPFVVEQEKTHDALGTKQIWVSQPSSGLDKRQATLQLCIHASGEQNIKPGIVFRGKGNVTNEEKGQYDSDAHVYFQNCAWMDTELNMQWLHRTLIPGMENKTCEKVIFADNVGFQQAKDFHEVCRKEVNALVYLLPENHTDKVQPIDAGYGKMKKKKIGESMERWLENDDNLTKWHDHISAKERRVLMTRWTGEAWREISANEEFFKKLFQKTGCLMTADSSEDENIRPQGLEEYEF